MSVVDYGSIDALAVSSENNAVMLIADHLDWKQEYEHLEALQTKINAYLDFIDSGQLWEMKPECEGNDIIFDLRFRYPLSDNAVKFLDTVGQQLKEANIYIKTKVDAK